MTTLHLNRLGPHGWEFVLRNEYGAAAFPVTREEALAVAGQILTAELAAVTEGPKRPAPRPSRGVFTRLEMLEF